MLALMPAAALAQAMNDPTRPPAGLGAAAEAEGDAGGAIRLQSVMISPTQKSAIINGVMVRLGEKYGDAVLVGVAESEVVLKSGAVRQVLKLHPGVVKRDSAAAATGGAPGKGGRRGEAAR